MKAAAVCCLLLGLVLRGTSISAEETPWNLHIIDNTSQGADGIDVADINGDGFPDLCVPWEEGGEIRVYLHPGINKVKQQWDRVTVGKVKSPEDAKFVDVDGDGSQDVVSCCEGKDRTVYIHWGPPPGKNLLTADWTTEPIPVTAHRQQWMYALPLQVDGKHGPDLILGSKGQTAEIGWLESPENPRELSAWQWHRISSAGWVMSLMGQDQNQDGNIDIVLSDRKGPERGCYWLRHPGSEHPGQEWERKLIGGNSQEVMFMVASDLDDNGSTDYLTAVSGGPLLWMFPSADPEEWTTQAIPLPDQLGTGKGVAVGDLNGDGSPDLVYSCENAKNQHGVIWLEGPFRAVELFQGKSHPVSGIERGVKFDLLQLLDLDGDGDLDILTCEERDQLGVIWYENPSR